MSFWMKCWCEIYLKKDFGFPQLMTTEKLKPLIVNPPIMMESLSTTSIPNFGSKIFQENTKSSKHAQRTVLAKGKNEIFVDIFEKISCLFNASTYVINSSIDGCIQMKSYLHGNPPLKLALNEDLVLGKGSNYGNTLPLDDYNFHECVGTNEFEVNRTLRINNPPEGEFTVMNYRITSDFQAPFRVYPIIDETSPYKLELNLKIKACYPKEFTASFVLLKFSVPKSTSNVHNETDTKGSPEKVEYNSGAGTVEWMIKKFPGESEKILKSKISLQSNSNTYAAKKEIGPINVSFEIHMYNISGLQVKYLKVEEKAANPYKWVRYCTQSNSYVCRT